MVHFNLSVVFVFAGAVANVMALPFPMNSIGGEGHDDPRNPKNAMKGDIYDTKLTFPHTSESEVHQLDSPFPYHRIPSPSHSPSPPPQSQSQFSPQIPDHIPSQNNHDSPSPIQHASPIHSQSPVHSPSPIDSQNQVPPHSQPEVPPPNPIHHEPHDSQTQVHAQTQVPPPNPIHHDPQSQHASEVHAQSPVHFTGKELPVFQLGSGSIDPVSGESKKRKRMQVPGSSSFVPNLNIKIVTFDPETGLPPKKPRKEEGEKEKKVGKESKMPKKKGM